MFSQAGTGSLDQTEVRRRSLGFNSSEKTFLKSNAELLNKLLMHTPPHESLRNMERITFPSVESSLAEGPLTHPTMSTALPLDRCVKLQSFKHQSFKWRLSPLRARQGKPASLKGWGRSLIWQLRLTFHSKNWIRCVSVCVCVCACLYVFVELNVICLRLITQQQQMVYGVPLVAPK
jgi:hypothetical protein